MRSIKKALLERSYAQIDAAELAKADPEIEYDPAHNSYRFSGILEVSFASLLLSSSQCLTRIGRGSVWHAR